MYRSLSPTSLIRVEARLKSGHSFWKPYREGGELIDLRELFSDYWRSNDQVFTVSSQYSSPTGPRRSD